MEAPPYAAPPSPQRRKSPWLIVAIVGAALCVCACPIGVAILFPVFSQAKLAAQRTSCMSNMKVAALAQLMYSSDFDERLPLSANWMDASKQYAQDEKNFRCPTVAEGGFGMALNSELAGKKTTSIKDFDSQILLLESSNTSKNASGTLELLPEPPRHIRNNVAFGSGGVGKTPGLDASD